MLVAFLLITTLGITLMIENNNQESLLEVVHELAEHFTVEWFLISLAVIVVLALFVALLQWLSKKVQQLPMAASRDNQAHSTSH